MLDDSSADMGADTNLMQSFWMKVVVKLICHPLDDSSADMDWFEPTTIWAVLVYACFSVHSAIFIFCTYIRFGFLFILDHILAMQETQNLDSVIMQVMYIIIYKLEIAWVHSVWFVYIYLFWYSPGMAHFDYRCW